MSEHKHENCCDNGCCDSGCDCENENENEIITLTDEDGKETDFVVIEGTEHNGSLYLALTEAAKADEDECEFTILKAIEDENGETLVTIDDQKEFDTVLALLQAKMESAGLFDFESVEDTDKE